MVYRPGRKWYRHAEEPQVTDGEHQQHRGRNVSAALNHGRTLGSNYQHAGQENAS
jgi:hypothetical protein